MVGRGLTKGQCLTSQNMAVGAALLKEPQYMYYGKASLSEILGGTEQPTSEPESP